MKQFMRQACMAGMLMLCVGGVKAQEGDDAGVRMARTVMTLWKDSLVTVVGKPVRWNYDQGVVLKGMEGLWNRTGDAVYFRYMQQCMDLFVTNEGNIRTYEVKEFNLDNVLCGRVLLTLYKVTGQEKYRKAASQLRAQLEAQPRTASGGFWHKLRYPDQMWLDGLYMGEPFYAEYVAAFGEDTSFSDIARQFMLMERSARDTVTGLLYHGWDESRKQRWANPETGLSPNFWGRAMGWYAMALVDVLDYFPERHVEHDSLVAILHRLATAVVRYQDKGTGCWFQVVNKGHEKGNYLEASASCMFVYALAKGVREGWLPASFGAVAVKGYDGILQQFIRKDASGQTNLEGTCSVAGLGGTPYRDGSYAYYLSEPVVTNDAKGVGAFLMAANEMAIARTLSVGKGRTLLLDSYFNNETRKDALGRVQSFHYKWAEQDNNGFSMWGHVFNYLGVRTRTLYAAPTAEALKEADMYLIVDPDIEKENPHPNFIGAADAAVLVNWVNAGGVLILMGNDTGNAEFVHFNQLADKFGIHFNEDSRNRVTGNKFEMGAFRLADDQPVLAPARKIYIKELSTLTVHAPARAVLQDSGHVIMATAKVGKGTVFAVGDPWLYNEYTDGRKLPPVFDNYKAALALSRWLIGQSAGRGGR